jgi:flagellar basal body-associated protein FliL
MDSGDDEERPSKVQNKGYGKHSVWWWVVVYLIVAVIVYGIIYLIFFNHAGGTGTLGY